MSFCRLASLASAARIGRAKSLVPRPPSNLTASWQNGGSVGVSFTAGENCTAYTVATTVLDPVATKLLLHYNFDNAYTDVGAPANSYANNAYGLYTTSTPKFGTLVTAGGGATAPVVTTGVATEGTASLFLPGSGTNGNAHFDMSGDGAVVPAMAAKQDATIALWMRYTANAPSTGGHIFDLGSSAAPYNYNFCLGMAMPTKAFLIQLFEPSNGGPSFSVPFPSTYQNVWMHFVVTVTSLGAINVYINGTLAKSGTGFYFNCSVDRDFLKLGRSQWGGDGDYGELYIDDFQLYATALTAAQVSQLYTTVPKPNVTVTTAATTASLANVQPANTALVVSVVGKGVVGLSTPLSVKLNLPYTFSAYGPPTESPLVAHYDMSSASNYVVSTLNPGNVTKLLDKASHFDLTSNDTAESGKNMLNLTGMGTIARPCVQITSTTGKYGFKTTGSTTPRFDRAVDAFFVLNIRSNGQQNFLMSQFSSSGAKPFDMFQGIVFISGQQLNTGYPLHQPTPMPTRGMLFNMTISAKSKTFTQRINGTIYSTPTAFNTYTYDATNTVPFYLGSRFDILSNNWYQAMDFGEVILLNSDSMDTLDPTTGYTYRQNVEGYLASKWGLSSDLPASHPYYNKTLVYTGTN